MASHCLFGMSGRYLGAAATSHESPIVGYRLSMSLSFSATWARVCAAYSLSPCTSHPASSVNSGGGILFRQRIALTLSRTGRAAATMSSFRGKFGQEIPSRKLIWRRLQPGRVAQYAAVYKSPCAARTRAAKYLIFQNDRARADRCDPIAIIISARAATSVI